MTLVAENVTLVARRREHFRGLRFGWLLNCLQNRCFSTQDIIHLLSSGVAISLSRALWRVHLNKAIWVLGHWRVDAPTHIWGRKPVFPKSFAFHRQGVCSFFLLNRYWGIVTVLGFHHRERAKGDAPTIRDRRRPSSTCPSLDNLECPDPHPAP